MTNITFEGDAPYVYENAFGEVANGCVVRIPYGNETYAVTDGKWQGMLVEYLPCEHGGGTSIKNAVEPTCTGAGYTGDTVCAICGVVFESGAAIDPLGHDIVEKKAAKEPTYYEDGWTHEVGCSRCDTILEPLVAIPKLVPQANLAVAEVQADEASIIEIKVFGGSPDAQSSVKLYLTYNTATAADIDLAKGAIDGETPKGGLKFPLTLSWEAGDIVERVVTIPVKADKAVEDDEFFTLQLAAPVGMELGDARVCTVTIRDPGYYDLEAKIASGTATKAEQTAWDKLLKAKAPYVRGLADPADAGKVASSGLCANGKKVTLKATANKGFVFNGWYDGDTLLSQAASYTPDMPETDKTLYAKFITAEEDRASIALSLSGMDLDSPSVAPVALETNITCGVALEWPLASYALSATTIKVSGLPAGLKFADKDVLDSKTKQVIVKANTIYGAPTAASKVGKDGKPTPSEVKITVTTAGKSSVTYLVKLTVDPLPAWAVGTFDGEVESGGIVQAFTVATSGKIGGKMLNGGTTWALSASSFDMVEDSAFFATVIGKAGKEIVTNEVEVAGVVVDGVGVGVASSDGWTAWQNLWSRPDTKAEMPVFRKSFDVTLESGLKLTFKKNGAVSFAGKVEGVSVSGSSQLVIADDGKWYATLYAPPKKGFDGWCATIPLAIEVDEDNVVIDVDLDP